jgi:4-amino-4-deoxy-L-arabinose transferase-like glycosyltransferase
VTEDHPTPQSPRAWLTPALLILLALALRLYHLDAQPIGAHSWRQSDTASIARNFARNGYDFLHPQIDWAGDKSGVVETEFPLYPFTVACIYAITGIHEWAARLVSALAGAAMVWVMFDLFALILGRRIACWGAFLLAVLPLCVYYGRTIQPEPTMLLFSAAGLNLFFRWSRSGRTGPLVASCVCIALACLVKLPALYLGLPIAWLCWHRLGPRMFLSPSLWLYATAVLGAVFAWYGYGYRMGQASGTSFGIINAGKAFNWQVLLDPEFYNIIIFRRLAERHFTWIGFALFVVGLCLPRRAPAERLFDVWMLAVVVYFLLAPTHNWLHEYYQVPFMLPGVVPAAKAIDLAWSRSRPLAAALIIGIAAMSGYRIFDYGQKERADRSPEAAAARAVAQISAPGDLVIAVDGRLPNNPTLLYLADRKGWALRPGALDVPVLRDLAARGAVAAYGATVNLWAESDRQWLQAVSAEFPLVHSADGTFVIDLRTRPQPG